MTIEVSPNEMPRPDAPRFVAVEWESESASFGGPIVAARYFPNPASPTCHVVFRAKNGGPNFFLSAPFHSATDGAWVQLGLFYALSIEEVLPYLEKRLSEGFWGRVQVVTPGLGLFAGARGVGACLQLEPLNPRWSTPQDVALFRFCRHSQAATRLQSPDFWAQLAVFLADENSEIGFARKWLFLSHSEREAEHWAMFCCSKDSLETFAPIVRAAIWCDKESENFLPCIFAHVWRHGILAWEGMDTRQDGSTERILGRFALLHDFYQPRPNRRVGFLCINHSTSRGNPILHLDKPSAHEKLEATLLWHEWLQARGLKSEE